jgi:hypothetical protein
VVTAVEAGLFGVTGLVIGVAALRAARRAWRRRAVTDRAAAPETPGVDTADDTAADPLAWVRRRRFGAGR